VTPEPAPRPAVDPALLNGARADTRWANLGFWRGTRSYPDAAAMLAHRVGRAAGLGPGDVVLDLACGLADSCALWIREFGVARVVGVEPDPLVVAEATARVKAWGLADRIVLRRERAEWVQPALAIPGITAIVCVDGAYHFHARASWLRALARDVPIGTRLGLADLLVTTRGRRSARLLATAARAGIPAENLWTASDVEPALGDCGWRLDRLVRCGREVLGGFAAHARRHWPRWILRPAAGGWRALGTAAAILAAGVDRRLDYAIIAARSVART